MIFRVLLYFFMALGAISVCVTVIAFFFVDGTRENRSSILMEIPKEPSPDKSAFDIEFTEAVERVGVVRLTAQCSGYMDSFQLISEEKIKEKYNYLSEKYMLYSQVYEGGIDVKKIRNDAFAMSIGKINSQDIPWIQNRLDFCTNLEKKIFSK